MSTAFSASWSPKSTSFFIHVVNMNMSIIDTHAFTWEKTISPSIQIDAHHFTPLGITLYKIVVEGVPIQNFPADYPIYYLFTRTFEHVSSLCFGVIAIRDFQHLGVLFNTYFYVGGLWFSVDFFSKFLNRNQFSL